MESMDWQMESLIISGSAFANVDLQHVMIGMVAV